MKRHYSSTNTNNGGGRYPQQQQSSFGAGRPPPPPPPFGRGGGPPPPMYMMMQQQQQQQRNMYQHPGRGQGGPSLPPPPPPFRGGGGGGGRFGGDGRGGRGRGFDGRGGPGFPGRGFRDVGGGRGRGDFGGPGRGPGPGPATNHGGYHQQQQQQFSSPPPPPPPPATLAPPFHRGGGGGGRGFHSHSRPEPDRGRGWDNGGRGRGRGHQQQSQPFPSPDMRMGGRGNGGRGFGGDFIDPRSRGRGRGGGFNSGPPLMGNPPPPPPPPPTMMMRQQQRQQQHTMHPQLSAGGRGHGHGGPPAYHPQQQQPQPPPPPMGMDVPPSNNGMMTGQLLSPPPSNQVRPNIPTPNLQIQNNISLQQPQTSFPATTLQPPQQQQNQFRSVQQNPQNHQPTYMATATQRVHSSSVVANTGSAAVAIGSSITTGVTAVAATPKQPPRSQQPQQQHTVQQIDAAWQEHTAPSGVIYYYNSILNESTYSLPDALLKKKMESTQSTTSSTPTTTQVWKEYEDPKTGMKYYSDGMSTSWTKPEGFVSSHNNSDDDDEDDTASSKLDNDGHNTTGEPQSKKQKRGNKNKGLTKIFTDKSEALSEFKAMLRSKDVSPTHKWNEVVRICQDDSTWDACVDILSIGERKQALSEYQTSRANQLRNEQREEINKAKEVFDNFLMEVAPTITSFSARTSTFADVRDILSKDKRFFVVKDEATRESLFLDFCDERQKWEERQKRNRKKEAQDAFISFLREKEEAGILGFSSTWGSFLASLAESEKSDSRFVTSVSLTDSDRQVFFADRVIELQKIEDDKRRRIREARRNAEKAQRSAYRDLLHQLSVDGKIFPYSRWRGDVEPLISKEDCFVPLQAQDRNAPRAMFEEFVDDWYELYQRERSVLKRLLESLLVDRSSDLSSLITSETTYKAFKDLLTDDTKHSSVKRDEAFEIINASNPVSSALIFYKDLSNRAKSGKRSSTLIVTPRRPSQLKPTDDSSDDEGEIIEDDEGTSTKKQENIVILSPGNESEDCGLRESNASGCIQFQGNNSVAKHGEQRITVTPSPGNATREYRECDDDHSPTGVRVAMDKDGEVQMTYDLLQQAHPFLGDGVKTCLSNVWTKKVESTFCCRRRSPYSTVQHVNQCGKWDCGWRNLQIMLSALLPNMETNHSIYQHIPLRSPVPVVPTLTYLQETLERAWSAGFDRKGSQHYDHKIMNKRCEIGALEVASLLWSWGVDASVLQFVTTKESRSLLPKFVMAYFSKVTGKEGCPFYARSFDSVSHAKALLELAPAIEDNGTRRGCDCHLLPLYLQWPGHSVTIVGIEKDGTFLVFNPLKNGQTMKADLKALSSPTPLRLNTIRKVSSRNLTKFDTQVIICGLRPLSFDEVETRKVPSVITAAKSTLEGLS